MPCHLVHPPPSVHLSIRSAASRPAASSSAALCSSVRSAASRHALPLIHPLPSIHLFAAGRHPIDSLSRISAYSSDKKLELSLVGLQNAGKTSLVNVIATGGYSEDVIPTVGFNMRKVTKENVTIKLWDLGGQRRFRTMWERYCRGVTTIVIEVEYS